MKNGEVNKVGNVIEFITDLPNFSILWFADAHIDNPKSKLNFIHKTIRENPDAFIIFGGDHHDLMQWKLDKRASYSALKHEHKTDDYFNSVIDSTRSEIIEKYKDRIICFTRGNHESMATRTLNFDFVKFLLSGYNIPAGDFAGYIAVTYNQKGHKRRNILYYQHKPNSGGKRSKGMLSVDILKGNAPTANLYITEHIHDTWIKPETREILTPGLNVIYETLWFVQAPTTKDEFSGAKNGFLHEKIQPSPTTIGCIKLDYNFRYINNNNNKNNKLEVKPNYILLNN